MRSLYLNLKGCKELFVKRAYILDKAVLAKTNPTQRRLCMNQPFMKKLAAGVRYLLPFLKVVAIRTLYLLLFKLFN